MVTFSLKTSETYEDYSRLVGIKINQILVKRGEITSADAAADLIQEITFSALNGDIKRSVHFLHPKCAAVNHHYLQLYSKNNKYSKLERSSFCKT